MVRHLLSHSAGLPGFDAPISEDQLFDWEYVCDRLASQAPWWEPGTMSAYHSMTQGWLLGEVLRRVDGRTMGTFFAEEVAGPIGADFHIGLADEHFSRVAELDTTGVEVPRLGDQDQSEMAERHEAHGRMGADIGNTDRWRRAEFPAANGHGNARSVAEVHSVVACGGAARGTTLLSPETVERIFEVQTDGHDAILGGPIRYGLGFGLPSESMPISPNGVPASGVLGWVPGRNRRGGRHVGGLHDESHVLGASLRRPLRSDPDGRTCCPPSLLNVSPGIRIPSPCGICTRAGSVALPTARPCPADTRTPRGV